MNNPAIKQILSIAKGCAPAKGNSFMLEVHRSATGELYYSNPHYVSDIYAAGRRKVALILNCTGAFLPDNELQPLVDAAREHLLLHGGSTPPESTYTGTRPQEPKKQLFF